MPHAAPLASASAAARDHQRSVARPDKLQPGTQLLPRGRGQREGGGRQREGVERGREGGDGGGGNGHRDVNGRMAQFNWFLYVRTMVAGLFGSWLVTESWVFMGTCDLCGYSVRTLDQGLMIPKDA